MPVAYDPLGGRLVESLGFKTVYNGGFVTGGSRCTSEPLLTMDEQVRTAGDIAKAVEVPVVADAGMRYDDPWLRAMILAPSLSRSMTAMLYGEPDLSELRALMTKPTSSVAMAFNDEPYPGISSDRFRGEAVVFPTTTVFAQRTAWLR